MPVQIDGDTIKNNGVKVADLPFLATNRAIIGASVLPIIIVWIILTILVSSITYSRTLGKRLQENCGVEYMENESMRYQVYRAYKANKNLLPVSTNVLLVSVIFLYVAASYEAYKLTAVADITVWRWIKLFHVFVIFAIFTVLSFISTWIAQLAGWSKVMKAIKYDVDIPKKTRDAVTIPYSIMFSTLSTFILVMFAIFRYCGVQSRMLYYFVPMIVIWVFGQFYLNRLVSLHNQAIAPYVKKKQQINKDIQEKLQGNDGTVLQRYLLANIRRADPESQVDNLKDNKQFQNVYADYLIHRNGKESFSETGDNELVSLATVKKELQPIYLYTVNADTTKFNADIQKINELLITKKVPEQLGFTDLSFQMRFAMFNLFYTFAGYTPIPSMATLHSSAPFPLRDMDINITVVQNTLKNYQRLPESIKKELIDTTPTTRMTAGQLLNKLVLAFETKDMGVDAFLCVALMSNWFDQRTMINLSQMSERIMDMQNALSSYERESTYTLLTMIRTSIDNVRAKIPTRKLQTDMAGLRNLDKAFMSTTSSFINSVLWISATVVILVAFLLFHIAYRMGKSMVTVGSISFVLFVFVASAWYSWFMGNIK